MLTLATAATKGPTLWRERASDLASGVSIYQTEVTTSHPKQTYIGLCDISLKWRYKNHTRSLEMNVTEIPLSLVNMYGNMYRT